MTENEILEQFAKKIVTDISKERKVVGFSWDVDYRHDTRPYWPYTLEAPGFSGRVWIRYAGPGRGFASDTFRSRTQTYTGTGGAGCYEGPWSSVYAHEYYARRLDLKIKRPIVECYSWDYRFLIDANQEFLGKLTEIIGQENLARALSDQGKYYLKHRFLFNEPGLVESDKEFVAQVKKLGGDELIKLKSQRY